MTHVVYFCQCGKAYRISARFSGRVSHCVRCRNEYIVPSLPPQTSMPPIAGADGVADESPDNSTEIASSPEEFDDTQLIESFTDSSETDAEFAIGILSTAVAPVGPQKKPILGKYEIREKIGEGGMGNVFAAWDTVLHREVAVKILNELGRKSNRFKERFLNEARITGQLEHSGIVPIYHFDYDWRGLPYCVMRMLEGRTLAQGIEQYHRSQVAAYSPETLRELLRHFIDACQTIAYAHDNFIVHRDIKPKNIMFGGYGETMVIDWGLAKKLKGKTDDDDDFPGDDADTSEPSDNLLGLTIVGNRVGTAGYQSLEYLRSGISRPSDDIYALGVTLYCLLCNRLPYKMPENHHGLFEILASLPPPPHLINPHIDRQLSAVCLCALASEAEKRYGRAEQLAADLQRWLDGKTVSVYRMNWKEKTARLLRKKAARIGIPLAAFLLGILFIKFVQFIFM